MIATTTSTGSETRPEPMNSVSWGGNISRSVRFWSITTPSLFPQQSSTVTLFFSDKPAVDETSEGAPTTDADLICSIHDRAGLTWDQIARLIGVSRRSVHMWVAGSPMSGRHRETLAKVDRLVTSYGNLEPKAVRTRLFTIGTSGLSDFDRFIRDRYDSLPNINGPMLSAAEMIA